MAIAIALLGFNDLGLLVTPNFLFRNRFYLQLSPHCPKMNKNQFNVGNEINFKISVRQDIEPCVKLWSLTANLFFEEPHQLAKFA